MDKHQEPKLNTDSLSKKVDEASSPHIYRESIASDSKKFVDDSHSESRFKTAIGNKGSNAILDHIKFSVSRDYVLHLYKLIKNYFTNVDPISKTNASFLLQQTFNALYFHDFKYQHDDPKDPSKVTKIIWKGYKPTDTSTFNISIPVFNLSTDATNAFAEYNHVAKGFAHSKNDSFKIDRAQIVDMARSTYQMPKNLYSLCISANFIFPIKIIPIPVDKGVVSVAPSTKDYRYIPDIDNKVNKVFNHKNESSDEES